MRGVDVSVYSGTISVEQWRKIRQDGYELAVVGLFHGRTANGFAGQQLSGAIEAGLEVAAYILVAPWTGWTGPQQVAAGMAQAQVYKDKLRFVAVDVEIDGVTETMIRDALSTVKGLGQRPIIYTGWWWWYGHFDDNHAFSHIPLWAADYDGEANLGTRMYGGWARAIGKQYAGTTMLHGVNVDLNWFSSEWVMEGEEMPGIGWSKEKLKLLNDFLDWWYQFPETQAAKDDEARNYREGIAYQRFFERQIAWRSPPR